MSCPPKTEDTGPLTSLDGFLNGRLRLIQPRKGYRAGTDPVLLAASVPALGGQSVLDLGCGVGTAGLCLAVRVPGVRITGLEVQPDYAAWAAENARANAIAATVVTGDVFAMPAELRQQRFDHVMMNPPYYTDSAAGGSADPGRDRAQRAAGADLAGWIDAGLRRLTEKGSLTVIQRTDRLSEILAALYDRAGAVRILPLTARSGRPADRLIVQGTKLARAPLMLLPPFVLHVADAHGEDGPDYTPAAKAILAEGGSLPIQSPPRATLT